MSLVMGYNKNHFQKCVLQRRGGRGLFNTALLWTEKENFSKNVSDKAYSRLAVRRLTIASGTVRVTVEPLCAARV